MSTRPTKTGRLASADERSRAQQIVDLYRAAMANGGSVVVNPQADPEEQSTYYAEPENLLSYLEHFAREGTFAFTDDLRPMMASAIAKRAGPSYDDRVAAVAK